MRWPCLILTVTGSVTPTVTLTGAPIVAVDTTYGSPSPTPTSFTVSGTDLTEAPGNLTVAPPAGFEVSLSSGSDYTTSLSVPYTTATLSSTTVYLRLAGSAAVADSPYSGDISVSGGGLASPATIATVASSVLKADPTVTVTVGSYTYSGSPQGATAYTINPTGHTGTATWSYVGTGSTTYPASAALPTDAGTYTATVSLDADSNFNAASSSATAFTIAKADQTITFTLTSPVARSAGTVNLTGTSNSGLTVNFASSDTEVATVSGSTLTLIKGGTITVTASQAGNNNYNAATDVSQSLTITDDSTPPTLAMLRVVSAAAYNSGTDSTSVTVEFTGEPNKTYQIAYSTDLVTWSAPAGYSTGATGTFQATFTKAGNVAADWKARLFFRATH